MDPTMVAAGIGGLSNLFGTLLQQAEQRKQNQAALQANALQQGYGAQKEAVQSLGQGQQSAFQQLMQQYQGIL